MYICTMKKIYYLYEIGVNIPMYVGMTKQELKTRLKSHKCSKGDCKREVWIRDAQTREGIGILLIEEVSNEIAVEREIYWTNLYFEKYPLVNLRIGNGASNELSCILSNGQKKKLVNYEQLKRLHESNRGKKRSEAFKENLKLKLKGRILGDIEKMKATQRERYGAKVSIDGILYGSIIEASEKTIYSKAIIKSYLYGKIKKPKYNITAGI